MALNKIAFTFDWFDRLILTGGSLTRRPKRSLRCLLAETTWQINEQNCKLPPLKSFWPIFLLLYSTVITFLFNTMKTLKLEQGYIRRDADNPSRIWRSTDNPSHIWRSTDNPSRIWRSI